MQTDKLQLWREELDALDDEIVSLFSRRFAICREVAAYKKETGIPMMQTGRVNEVKKRAAEKGRARGLREVFVTELYDLIIDEACEIEDEIIDGPQRRTELFGHKEAQKAQKS
jgi:4-amino-4-deoxychorismate mutase